MKWEMVRLGEVAEVNMGQAPDGSSYNQDRKGLPLIAGAADFGDSVPSPKKYTSVPTRTSKRGDILMCIRATIGDLNWSNDVFCLGRGVAGLRAIPSKLDPNFLWHVLSSSKEELNRLGSGSTFRQIGRDAIQEFVIPLPPLNEQKRIAAILDKADAIRRKRQEAINLSDQFLRSVFLDMFGDPVTNPKGWEVKRLGDVVTFISGGTPTKSDPELWKGDLAWVSPKDMKVNTINSSIDTINSKVVKEGALKLIPRSSILLVVRGMILAHTIPLAISNIELTINQDMKALEVNEQVLPIFLLWNLIVQHDHILTKVSSAAHGTKRLELDLIKNLQVLVPDIEQQAIFVAIDRTLAKIQVAGNKHMQGAEGMFNSLSVYSIDYSKGM